MRTRWDDDRLPAVEGSASRGATEEEVNDNRILVDISGKRWKLKLDKNGRPYPVVRTD